MSYRQVIEDRKLPSPEIRRALRLSAGFTLDDVADLLGVSKGAVWKWETGLRRPRSKNRNEYAKILTAFREVIHDD